MGGSCVLTRRLRSRDGRGGGIRTPGPLLPKQMRYQAALRPDVSTRLYRGTESDSQRTAQKPGLVSQKPRQKPNNQKHRNRENKGQPSQQYCQKAPVAPCVALRLTQVTLK